MNLIDRFTRDRVSKVVWSLAFIALAGVFAASIVMGTRARDAELSKAGDRAARELRRLVDPTLSDLTIQQSLPSEALAAIQVAVDPLDREPGVNKVRLWNLEDFAIFTTDAREMVPSSAVQNEGSLAQAAAGGGVPLIVGSGADLHTYVLLSEAQLIGEVVLDRSTVLTNVDAMWGSARTATGVGAGLMLLLTLLSFRPPVALVGAGVPFVPENVPPGTTLIDEERLRAVNDVYALAQQRVDKLKERLQLAENERQFLQGELQRALSGFAPSAPATRAPMATPTEPLLSAEIVPSASNEPRATRPPKKKKPARRVEEVPAAAVVSSQGASPTKEEVAEPTPDAAEILAAAAEVGEVVEASAKAELAASEVVELPTEVVQMSDEIVELPESEVVSAAPNDREAAAVGAWSYPSAPEVAALREEPTEDARSARELLDRLMSTETHEIGGPDADPGRIREQIARVAAKKKPGGGEAKKLFQEPEGPKPPWMRDRDR